ncbi:OmpA family protein [Acanthopleuribacter pedis]|uniref:OmpA family protein n=1 Tax=Acanthopleuribacter pedis TaxID=442870 RepID=A0A8J7QBT1_9BACT|nr:OmpA family protein [Acanthopleuribacter pedis]MBO1320910.1 OmpA family protein [Acanthopleuribacter pedis]
MIRALTFALILGFVLSPAHASDNLEDINFPLNSSVVVDGFQGLDLLAAVMKKHNNLDLEVVGYTDSIGTTAYNKRLSLQRANAVKSYLEGKGVTGAKIATSGEGVDSTHNNQNREGRFQNRRVSLFLFETTNGTRRKVSYERLLFLFFGKAEFAEAQAESTSGGMALGKQDEILKKLSDLEKEVQALKDSFNLPDSGNGTAAPVAIGHGGVSGKWNAPDNVSGVSFGLGMDNDNKFTGRLEGLYFKPVSEHFAVQLQGDVNYYDNREEEGQFDAAFVYQQGYFKIAAAGSYKYASIDGFDTARMGQGALIADIQLERGKVGLFATSAFADGDVLATTQIFNTNPAGVATQTAFANEWYVNVPNQYGMHFGFSMTDTVDFSGHFGAIDGESDASLSASLKLDVLIRDNFSWYLSADMNESHLINDDDSFRYLAGIKMGSWASNRYRATPGLSPVDIPRVRYEILARRIRNGNTAPIAEAGASRTEVPAGTVVLDGSQSYDPEADALTYQWVQTSGPSVEIQNAESARAQFTGVAGETYAFQLTVRDNFGGSSSDLVRIQMEAAPIPVPTVSFFRATPDTIDLGGISNLSWNVTDADSVEISGIGVVDDSGVLFLSPEATTTYTLTATNVTGSVTAEVTVTVRQLPTPTIGFFTATPDDIKQGEFTTLSWSTQNAETVTISNLGQVAATATVILTPEATVTYTLTATNSAGSATAEVTVNVGPPNQPPIAAAGADQSFFGQRVVTLDGSRSFDPDGDALTYQWTQLSGLPVELTGGDTATPTFTATRGSYEFRLIVRDTSGSLATDDVRITVVEFKR